MQHIRVPGLENWSDEFHSLPMLESSEEYLFPVNVQESALAVEWRLIGPAWLRITPDKIALVSQARNEDMMNCPFTCIRKFGKDSGVVSFELGTRAPTGQGVLYLTTLLMDDIMEVVRPILEPR